MRDLLLHAVEAENQLLVARDPVNHGVGHVLQVLRLLLARLDIVLCRFLQLESVVSAA